MQWLLSRLGTLPGKPEARESLEIAPLNWVLKRLAGILVAGFEVVEPVISVAGFGLEETPGPVVLGETLVFVLA